MKQLSVLGLGLALVWGLSACGNKGALYLPEQPDPNKPVPTASKAPQKQQIEKKQ